MLTSTSASSGGSFFMSHFHIFWNHFGLVRSHLKLVMPGSNHNSMQRTSVRHSSSRNIDFCRTQQLNMIGFRNHGRRFFRLWNGSDHCKWKLNSLLYRKHLNFSTSSNHTASQSYRIPDLIKICNTQSHKKNLFLHRNIPRRQTLPSTVAIHSQKSWISPVSFLSWIFVLSSSKTLIHTSSLIESKIAYLENSSEPFSKKVKCDCILAVYGYVRRTNLR